MSTPAEIIAARIAANANKHDDLIEYSDSDNEEGVESLNGSIPLLKDESAFPALAKRSQNSTPTTSTWVSGAVSAATAATSAAKSSTVQEAFSLDADDQLNVARPEFIKVLQTVKSETKTNIECTTSQLTKKRTFLITGKPEDVKLAKRLVIKKLTKPVKISFTVPSKLRSRIIGPGGKTLKPIISQFEVRIDIGNEETIVDGDESNDDIFNKLVTVSIDGDVEGSKLAKAKILEIVKQETKTLSIKLPIDDDIKPFVSSALQDIVESSDLDILVPDHKSLKNTITIIGDRDAAIDARDLIVSRIDQLSSRIVVDEVPIPKIKQQFLPIDQILSEDNVLIKLPLETEANVKFIGERSKIAGAKEKARKTTSQYKVEVLDMSKAHKGNLPHVSAVAEFLKSKGFFKSVGDKHNVTINAPSSKYLNSGEVNSIPIELVVKTSESGENDIKASKKEIVAAVNSLSPDSVKVIDDIDHFLLNKVDSQIGELAKNTDVSYVILNGRITLFNTHDSIEESEDFDFEDPATNDNFETINNALNPLRELKANLASQVLDIPSASQKFVSGRNNTTLNALLSSVEPNSVIVKLNNDGTGFADDKLYIHGLKTQVSSIRKAIEEVIQDSESYGDKYTATASIPSTILSRLIGKNGQFLNSLRDEFGVKIDVEEEEETKSDIVIVGIKRNVEACKSRVVSLSKKWADETTARLKIESQYHRRMIGANGKFINRLQDKYGVRIRFPSATELASPSPDSPRNKDEVTIRGPSKSVAGAREELEELHKFEKDNGFEQIISIPTKAIARVIGKSGETINDIADATGIEYNFKRDDDKEKETGLVEVKLVGSKAGLKDASSKINSIVDEVENFVSIDLEVDSKYHREIIGQGGSKMREIITNAGGDDLPRSRYHRLLSIPNEGSGSNVINSQGPKHIVNKIVEQLNEFVALKESSILIEIEVPKDKHRLLVGPSGSTRQSLEKEFGVTIEIPRADDKSPFVKLSGLPEKIEEVKAKIQDLTKDDWNHSIMIPETYHAFVSEGGQIFKTLRSKYDVEVSHEKASRKASRLSSVLVPNPPEEEEEFLVKPLDLVDSDVEIPWRLKGKSENTAKVLELLENRLELAKQSTFGAWLYAADASKFSKVVGPGGSTVKNIKEKSNTLVVVPKSTDKNSHYIYIIGTEENLKIAKTLITKYLK